MSLCERKSSSYLIACKISFPQTNMFVYLSRTNGSWLQNKPDYITKSNLEFALSFRLLAETIFRRNGKQMTWLFPHFRENLIQQSVLHWQGYNLKLLSFMVNILLPTALVYRVFFIFMLGNVKIVLNIFYFLINSP